MGRLKNYLLVVVGFAIAGMIGAAFGTGTAQAVVSTLVSVVNPGTSPVYTSSVDDPGRIAYQSTIVLSCSGNDCHFIFPTVPAGHRVVVQHIGGFANFTSTPTLIYVVISSIPGATISGVFLPSVTTFTVFDQAVLFYIDSSVAPVVDVQTSGGNFSDTAETSVTLIGYELDCTVAACAPIATQ